MSASLFLFWIFWSQFVWCVYLYFAVPFGESAVQVFLGLLVTLYVSFAPAFYVLWKEHKEQKKQNNA